MKREEYKQLVFACVCFCCCSLLQEFNIYLNWVLWSLSVEISSPCFSITYNHNLWFTRKYACDYKHRLHNLQTEIAFCEPLKKFKEKTFDRFLPKTFWCITQFKLQKLLGVMHWIFTNQFNKLISNRRYVCSYYKQHLLCNKKIICLVKSMFFSKKTPKKISYQIRRASWKFW